VAVSQELLFLLMITGELCALVLLYNFWVIPKVSKKTITQWEEKMLSGEFDVPAMLEGYTDHLMERMSEFMIGFFHSAAANAAKKIGKTDEGGQLNLVRGMLDNLSDEPWYIQALAPRLLNLLETAGVPGETAAKALKKAYKPGLDRP
jgi:hypothetical protein